MQAFSRLLPITMLFSLSAVFLSPSQRLSVFSSIESFISVLSKHNQIYWFSCILIFLVFFKLSFLIQALKHPDVFCLAEHKGDSPLVATDILKSAPNEDDREIATW